MEFKIVKKSLLEIIRDAKKFVIPIYQRDYSWDDKLCNMLFETFAKSVKEPNTQDEELFFGSLICTENEKGEIAILDGQQRITSTFIFLLVLRNLYKDKSNFKSEQFPANTRGWIENLLAPNSKIKLESHNEDKFNIESLYNGNPLNKGKVYYAANIFWASLVDLFENSPNVNIVESLLKSINKSYVSYVTIPYNSNVAQNIFESINSSSLSLTVSELAINNMLMQIPNAEDQDKFYKDYILNWQKGLNNKKKQIDDLFNVFINIFAGKQMTATDTFNNFQIFKSVTRNYNYNYEKLFSDFNLFYEAYLKIEVGKTFPPISSQMTKDFAIREIELAILRNSDFYGPLKHVLICLMWQHNLGNVDENFVNRAISHISKNLFYKTLVANRTSQSQQKDYFKLCSMWVQSAKRGLKSEMFSDLEQWFDTKKFIDEIVDIQDILTGRRHALTASKYIYKLYFNLVLNPLKQPGLLNNTISQISNKDFWGVIYDEQKDDYKLSDYLSKIGFDANYRADFADIIGNQIKFDKPLNGAFWNNNMSDQPTIMEQASSNWNLEDMSNETFNRIKLDERSNKIINSLIEYFDRGE
jgi:uncharacterized protein with ParB-like and HNH nuclease domain